MSRSKAAGIHLLLSIVVALVMLVLVFKVWYPGGYYQLLGVGSIYLILMGVDVCLGPLLTFVVYKAGKKSLRFDLTTIVVLQLSALLYGIYIVFNARPVFNVFEDDVFKVVLAPEIEAKNLALAKKAEWQTLPIWGPKLVAAVAPTTQEDKNAMTFLLDWSFFPKLYVDYDSRKQEAFKHAKPLADLHKLSKSSAVVDAFLADAGRPASDFIYLPIVHAPTLAGMTAVLDAKTADFIDMIAIDTP